MKSIAKTLSRLAALIILVAILMSLSQTAHALSTPEVNTGRVKRIAGGYWPAPPGFGGNLSGAQVNHFNAPAFHHHAHQVFANVVQVALDRANANLAAGLDVRPHQVGL